MSVCGKKTSYNNKRYLVIMDYMSDDFLKVTEPQPVSKKRVRQQSCIVQPLGKKQIMEQMHIRREEGLESKIESTNKGFMLLQKMGYTEGSGLGKNESGSEAPIRVTVRETTDRSGIGVAAESKKIIERVHERIKLYRTEDLEAGFQASLRRKQQLKLLNNDVRLAEKAIMELDIKCDVDRHNLWPEDVVVDNSDGIASGGIPKNTRVEIVREDESVGSSGDEYLISLQRLEHCIVYLRATYRYCMYCGCSFTDMDDLSDNCPGPLREDHD